MIKADDIMSAVSEYFDIKQESIIFGNRSKRTASARIVAMYLFREFLDYSWFEIGEYFNKSHATAIQNCKRLVKLLREEPSHKMVVATIDLINAFKDKNTSFYLGV